MKPENRTKLLEAEKLIREVADDYKGYGEHSWLNRIANELEDFKENQPEGN